VYGEQQQKSRQRFQVPNAAATLFLRLKGIIKALFIIPSSRVMALAFPVMVHVARLTLAPALLQHVTIP
jgi:hypothetical protein